MKNEDVNTRPHMLRDEHFAFFSGMTCCARAGLERGVGEGKEYYSPLRFFNNPKATADIDKKCTLFNMDEMYFREVKRQREICEKVVFS